MPLFTRAGPRPGSLQHGKEVWAEEETTDAKRAHAASMIFPIGAPNDGYAQFFSGKSYLGAAVYRAGRHLQCDL